MRAMLVPMFKMPAAVTALFVSGLVGLACSSSGLKRSAGDAGAASGGQAGSTISSGNTGGSGGTIGPGGSGGVSTGGTIIGSGGAGGATTGGTGGTIGSGGSNGAGGTAGSSDTGGTGGQGGTAGSPPSQGGICALYPMCNPGDHQVAMGIGRDYTFPPGTCPAERECYSLNVGCGPILCMVSQDAGVDAGASDAGVDASGKPEPDSSSQRAGAPHPQPCLAGEVLNFGEMCPCVAGPPLCSSSFCEPRGDGWCYTQCTPPQQGGSCAGGLICGPIMIFGGGDVGYNYYLCDGPIGAPVGAACRSSFNYNDCNGRASCVTSTHCGDASVCSVCQN